MCVCACARAHLRAPAASSLSIHLLMDVCVCVCALAASSLSIHLLMDVCVCVCTRMPACTCRIFSIHSSADGRLGCFCSLSGASSLVAQALKNPPAKRETWVRSLGCEDPLEEGTAKPLQCSWLETPMDGGAVVSPRQS